MGDATAGGDDSGDGEGEGNEGEGQTTDNSGDPAEDDPTTEETPAGEPAEGVPTTGEAPGDGDDLTPGEISLSADPDVEFSNPPSMGGVAEGRNGVDATIGPEVQIAGLIDDVPLPQPADRDYINFLFDQEQLADKFGIPPYVSGLAEEYATHPNNPFVSPDVGYNYFSGPDGSQINPYGALNGEPALALGGDELAHDPGVPYSPYSWGSPVPYNMDPDEFAKAQYDI